MANVLKLLWLQTMQKLRKNTIMNFKFFAVGLVLVSVRLFVCLSVCKLLSGRSQTTFTAMGGGEVRQMSTLLNRYGKFY